MVQRALPTGSPAPVARLWAIRSGGPCGTAQRRRLATVPPRSVLDRVINHAAAPARAPDEPRRRPNLPIPGAECGSCGSIGSFRRLRDGAEKVPLCLGYPFILPDLTCPDSFRRGAEPQEPQRCRSRCAHCSFHCPHPSARKRTARTERTALMSVPLCPLCLSLPARDRAEKNRKNRKNRTVVTPAGAASTSRRVPPCSASPPTAPGSPTRVPHFRENAENGQLLTTETRRTRRCTENCKERGGGTGEHSDTENEESTENCRGAENG